MKKILLFISVFLFSINSFVFSQTGPSACNDILTIKGKDFYCGGNKFYPLVCNYRFTLAHNGLTPSASDYYLSPYVWYGTDLNFDCIDEGSCLQKLSDDFAIIHQLGFNAIRTAQIAPAFNVYNHTTPPENFHELGTLTPNDFAIWASCNVGATDWSGKSFIFSPDPQVTDTYRDQYLLMTKHLLETAYANSLKVFLDVQYGKILESNWYPSYLNWITVLTQYIHSLPLYLRQTLAAYVVVEEPPIAEMSGTGYDKHTICEKTTEMYDLIKDNANDPEHLITIGGGEADYNQLQNWDAGVMKYDFVSPHLYPFQRFEKNTTTGIITGEQNSDFAVERVLSYLYWLKNYCPYPFMIGETGFGAIDDGPGVIHYPDVNGLTDGTDHGEYYNQKNYTHDVMKMTRDCGGSGFSIWQYQEGNGDPYGILGTGNASSSWTTLKKPVCDEFANYLDANGLPPDPDLNGAQMPAFYYDPYHYGNTLTGGTNGFVEDIVTHEKIKGAYIIASINMAPHGSNLGDYTSNYTFSHEETGNEGKFFLLPYDWKNLQVKSFNDFYISAVGTSRLHYGGDASPGYFSDPTTTIINGNTYLLNRNTLNNQNDIKNITLTATQSGNYNGFSVLNVSNFIAESQSSADLKGAFEVNLHKESILKNGAEVLLHTGQVFPDCSEFSNYLRIRNPNVSSQTQTDTFNNNIELDFKLIKNNMIVFPNPTSGNITFAFTKNEVPFTEIKIQNVIGTLVAEIHSVKHNFSYDLSFLPKGIYFILSMSVTNQQSLKLIIN